MKFVDGRQVRLLRGNLPREAALVSAAAAAKQAREVRDLHLLSFVFHRLTPEGRQRALAIAQQFLSMTQRLETYAGVFLLVHRLTAVPPYTQDNDRLLAAVNRILAAAERGIPPASDTQMSASQRFPQAQSGWDSDFSPLSQHANLAAGGDQRMQAVMQQMMLFQERTTRYQASTRTLTALLALIEVTKTREDSGSELPIRERCYPQGPHLP